MQDGWPDDALYTGVVERDPNALEALIRRYSREMAYFIRLMLDGVGTAQDVEECTNDLFVAVWQDFASFDSARASLRTWLTMRAKYIALDRRRQVQRRTAGVTSLDGTGTAPNGSDSPRAVEVLPAHLTENNLEGLLEQRERRDALVKALEALPELDRYLVYMRYFRLASTDEISEKTQLSRQAIDTRLWRARRTLRVALEEQIYERVQPL